MLRSGLRSRRRNVSTTLKIRDTTWNRSCRFSVGGGGLAKVLGPTCKISTRTITAMAPTICIVSIGRWQEIRRSNYKNGRHRGIRIPNMCCAVRGPHPNLYLSPWIRLLTRLIIASTIICYRHLRVLIPYLIGTQPHGKQRAFTASHE